MTDTVDLHCKKCGENWTEDKEAFLERFQTGRLGHLCTGGSL